MSRARSGGWLKTIGELIKKGIVDLIGLPLRARGFRVSIVGCVARGAVVNMSQSTFNGVLKIYIHDSAVGGCAFFALIML